jgi:hypothetical protein
MEHDIHRHPNHNSDSKRSSKFSSGNPTNNINNTRHNHSDSHSNSHLNRPDNRPVDQDSDVYGGGDQDCDKRGYADGGSDFDAWPYHHGSSYGYRVRVGGGNTELVLEVLLGTRQEHGGAVVMGGGLGE